MGFGFEHEAGEVEARISLRFLDRSTRTRRSGLGLMVFVDERNRFHCWSVRCLGVVLRVWGSWVRS